MHFAENLTALVLVHESDEKLPTVLLFYHGSSDCEVMECLNDIISDLVAWGIVHID